MAFAEPHGLRVPPTMNLHLTNTCNYSCKYCYQQSVRAPLLPLDTWQNIVKDLAAHRVEKVTFVGGEPFLVPWLRQLVAHAHDLGLRTCIVTNGSRVAASDLATWRPILDQFAVSIDSFDETISQTLGRGTGAHVQHALDLLAAARDLGISTKLNTVVTQLNHHENVIEQVRAARPNHWKVFQMLAIEGENDAARHLAVSHEQFAAYLARNRPAQPIGEDNEAMTESYGMIDPLGRPFQNTGGRYTRGPAIQDVGFPAAWSNLRFDLQKFEERGGRYSLESHRRTAGEALPRGQR